MKLGLNIFFVIFGLSISAMAGSNSKICSDSSGEVLIVDGEVTIKDGIGSVGAPLKQVVLATVSEQHQKCVDGPNYISKIITVEKVSYNIEENVTDRAIVLCTQTLTGIMPPGSKCK